MGKEHKTFLSSPKKPRLVSLFVCAFLSMSIFASIPAHAVPMPDFGTPFYSLMGPNVPWNGYKRGPTDTSIVNTLTGNLICQGTDLNIPSRGMPFVFKRTYNAHASDIDSPLGFGWTHSYNIYLTEAFSPACSETFVIVHWGDGGGEYFRDLGAGLYDHAYCRRKGDGTYEVTPLHGQYNILVKVGDTWTLTNKLQIKYTFRADGKCTSIVDRNGNTVTLGYDGSGHLTSITDTQGRSYTLLYSGDHITSISDNAYPGGPRVLSYGYSGSNLTHAYDAFSRPITFFHDGNCINRIVDRRGNSVYFSYDSVFDNRRVTSQTDARGNVTTYAYDYGAAQSTVTGPPPSSYQWVHHYNFGEMDSFQLTQKVDSRGYTEYYTYDSNNNLIHYQDKRGTESVYVLR